MMRSRHGHGLVALGTSLGMLGLLALGARAQCPLRWQAAPLQSTFGTLETALAYDDGQGLALWVGGRRGDSLGLTRGALGRWDGQRWSWFDSFHNGAFGSEIVNVDRLTAFDDGAGPALYVAGFYERIDNAIFNSVARWTGAGWEPLGSGLRIDAWDPGQVFAVEVFDDGSGPALYVGGFFATAGGQPAANVARWDGMAWQPLGGGTDGSVFALEAYDDGSGPQLYAGGSFSQAGAQPVQGVARWDGSAWHDVGGGFDGPVDVLAGFDDGSGNGPRLYAGGRFTKAGAATATGLAIWNGTLWRQVGGSLGGGTLPHAEALAVHDDGGGPALFVGGVFDTAGTIASPNAARWDGNAWSALDTGVGGRVAGFATWSDCAGAAADLLAHGAFESAGGDFASRLALWGGGAWRPISESLGANGPVGASVVWDDGGGEALYAAGTFTRLGAELHDRMARWDGQAWSSLGAGLDGEVGALLPFNDGSGEKLYAAGSFDHAGGIVASSIARWNGATWEPVGGGIAGVVRVLHVHDDGGGGGPQLYAGGDFAPGEHLLRWDGASWQGTSQGLIGGTGWSRGVWSLESFAPNGGTSALYAGVGSFLQTTGTYSGGIRRWDGSAWSTFVLANSAVQALEAWTDPQGISRLYVGGQFASIGPIAANRLARWDGTLWLPLSFGVDGFVRSFAAWDDGGGEALYVGGRFSVAGTQPANAVARWDGNDFSSLGSGLGTSAYQDVRTITALPSAQGAGLFVGGALADAMGVPTANLAWWRPDCSVVNFCSTSPNSVGPGALISASGSVSICANDFTLVATDAPKNVFGNFYYGPLAAQVPLGNGLRCIGGSVIRLLPAQSTGSSGTLQRLLDFTQPPAGGGPGQVLAGSTWHFQFWYRDPNGGGAGFNLSDGLRATFVP